MGASGPKWLKLLRIYFSNFRDWLREFLKMGCFCEGATASHARIAGFRMEARRLVSVGRVAVGRTDGPGIAGDGPARPPNLVGEVLFCEGPAYLKSSHVKVADRPALWKVVACPPPTFVSDLRLLPALCSGVRAPSPNSPELLLRLCLRN